MAGQPYLLGGYMDKRLHNEKVCKVLETAREFLGENGESWTRGELARDAQGRRVELYKTENLPSVAQVCMLGAIRVGAMKIGLDFSDDKVYRAKELVREATGTTTIPEFNDAPSTTFKDVRRVFDKAIENCKAS
jgi:hypothetical protein